MRGLFLSFSHPSLIVLVGLVVLSTHFLWAQRTLPLGKIPIQLLDTPAPFARVSETQPPMHLAYRRLPLSFEQGDSHPRTTTNAALYPTTRAAEQRGKLWGKEEYLIGNAPSKWRTFAFTYDKTPRETICCVGNLEHYVHRMPWAGSIILRIAQQAKAHPHVTRVMRVLKPKL